jgi:hypothetical protein
MERAELTAIVASLIALRRMGGISKMGDSELDTCVGEATRIINRADEFAKMSPEDLAKRLAGKRRMEAIDKDKTDMKIPEGALDDTPSKP